jgi:hypothetical protein
VKKHLYKSMLFALGLMLVSPDASAATQKDMQILGRALGFIENGPSGDVKIGIVTDSGNAASLAEANELASIIGSGLKSGKINLQAEKVATGAAAGSGHPVLYFTEGTEASHASIFNAVSSKGTITVSTHDSCLNASQCVMVVKSVPKVDIKVSSAAAGSTGVSFGSAFRMMISEQ